MLLHLLLLICFISALFGAELSISSVEYEALQDLFNSTNGMDWQWKNETEYGPEWFNAFPDPCMPIWQGLNCSCVKDNCTISEIKLIGYDMQGTLPDSIGNFSSLTKLVFAKTRLQGTLPPTVGRLANLTLLDITFSHISGTIPDVVYGLSNLESLGLQFSNFSGSISSDIGRLTKLKVLHLERNRLTGSLPDQLYDLTNLTVLRTDDNSLTGTLSYKIGSLSKLTVLFIKRNNFRGSLPKEIGNLQNLIRLDALGNAFVGKIPEELYNCTKLKEFSLAANFLTGSISETVVKLKSLTGFIVGSNDFAPSTIPNAVCHWHHLLYLNMNRMNLVGKLPSCLWNLENITQIEINDNRLFGTLPSSISSKWLAKISLNSNLLNGTLGTGIANLPNLLFLELGSNKLTGSLPAFRNGKRIVYLDLSDNKFDGTLPPYVFEMTALRELNLNNTNFAGFLPENISNLSHLISLNLGYNNLDGTLPNWLFSLKSISTVNLERNKFTGSIPLNLNRSSLISSISLNDNSLTGSIPTWLCKLPLLQVLYLNLNHLSQSVPSCILKNPKLETFEVHSNQLTGTVDSQLNSSITNLQLQRNSFSGSLPAGFGDQMQIYYSYLNQFTGTLPVDLFRNKLQMQSMSVDSNYLTGVIPSALGDMISLTEFCGYDNLLDGTLPSVKRLSSLYIFSVNNNFLSGNVNIFNSTSQLSLTTVDLSVNQFTGTLPLELFNISSMQAFAAVQNCFTGSIPDSVCRAGFTALALDGLHTASSCRLELLGGNYALKYLIPGTIPSCIFNMANLMAVSLSGNALKGSIPYDIAVAPTLQNISVAYNSLSGSIPKSFQLQSFLNWDMSFNNFGGHLLEFKSSIPDNGSVHMQVNRLSGRIPSLLKDLRDVSILNGNIFQCKIDREELPKHDKHYINYECGTSSLQHSMYIFVILFGLGFGAMGFIYLRNSNKAVWFTALKWKLRIWWDTLTKDDAAFPQLMSMNIFISRVCQGVAGLTVFIVCILMPVYVCLSSHYSMYESRYSWIVSSVYLAGFVPAVSMLVLYTSFSVCLWMTFLVVGRKCFTESKRKPKLKLGEIQKRSLIYCGLSGLFIFNCIVILNVNVFYNFLLIQLTPEALTFFQVSLAGFKLFWNSIVVRSAMNNLHSYFVKRYNLTTEDEKFWIPRYFRFNSYLALMNVIIIPCLATSAVSSDCFYHVYVQPVKVTSSLSYSICDDFSSPQSILETINSNCSTLGYNTITTTYLPPYIYRYQCASTLVTTYAVVYVYKFILIAFVQPLFYACMIYVRERYSDQSRLYKFAERFVPHVAKSRSGSRLFSVDRFNLSLILYLSVFVTFGVMFPPLAVMICISIVIQTRFTQVIFGRLLANAKEDLQLQMKSILNNDVADLGVNMKRAVHIIGGPAAFFYSYFVFDTYGDQVGAVKAIWMTVTMFAISTLSMLIYRRFAYLDDPQIKLDSSIELTDMDKDVVPKPDDDSINVLHDRNEM